MTCAQELVAGEDDDMFDTAARTKTRKKQDVDEKEKASKCAYLCAAAPSSLEHTL
jgi:hypothetical protein